MDGLADRLWMRARYLEGLDRALMREASEALRVRGEVDGAAVLAWCDANDFGLLPWQRKKLEGM